MERAVQLSPSENSFSLAFFSILTSPILLITPPDDAIARSHKPPTVVPRHCTKKREQFSRVMLDTR
jgi:hypothetical protein